VEAPNVGRDSKRKLNNGETETRGGKTKNSLGRTAVGGLSSKKNVLLMGHRVHSETLRRKSNTLGVYKSRNRKGEEAKIEAKKRTEVGGPGLRKVQTSRRKTASLWSKKKRGLSWQMLTHAMENMQKPRRMIGGEKCEIKNRKRVTPTIVGGSRRLKRKRDRKEDRNTSLHPCYKKGMWRRTKRRKFARSKLPLSGGRHGIGDGTLTQGPQKNQLG